jgi:hypothetical protein
MNPAVVGDHGVEECTDGRVGLAPPRGSETIGTDGGVDLPLEPVADGAEGLLLTAGEWSERFAASLEERELREQDGAYVSRVLNRLVQPSLQPGTPAPRWCHHDPLGPTISLLNASRLNEANVAQVVDGPVDERSADGPDPAEFGIGGQVPCDVEAVPGLLAQHAEHQPVVQRQ